jgi:hypothetical protein
VTAVYFAGITAMLIVHGGAHVKLIIAAAILSAASMSAFAQNGQGGNQNPGPQGGHHAAPGPLLGAGLPGLAVGGIGYGIYWVVRRRRRKTTEA